MRREAAKAVACANHESLVLEEGMTTETPHKVCTPEEYFFLYRPKGKHSVCFNYDYAGNVAIWFLATKGQKCGYDMECLPDCAFAEGGQCAREENFP